MGLFTPVWKKNDSKSEQKAIELIAKKEDQGELSRIATEAPSLAVRLAAVKKLTDQNTLAQIVVSSATLAPEALNRITDNAALRYIISADELTSHRIAAAAKLEDHETGQKIIGDAARNDKEEAVRIQAVQLLDNQEILADIASTEKKSIQVMSAAVRQVTDPALLAKIAGKGSHGHARSFALSRISDPKLKEEVARELLTDAKAGSDVWQTAIECTDDQASVISLVRNPVVHKELKIKAIRKITDKDFLNEIIHSEDDTFKVSAHTFSVDGTKGISFLLDLKPYAEEQLMKLEKKS